jgi:hypothetical protein
MLSIDIICDLDWYNFLGSWSMLRTSHFAATPLISGSVEVSGGQWKNAGTPTEPNQPCDGDARRCAGLSCTAAVCWTSPAWRASRTSCWASFSWTYLTAWDSRLWVWTSLSLGVRQWLVVVSALQRVVGVVKLSMTWYSVCFQIENWGSCRICRQQGKCLNVAGLFPRYEASKSFAKCLETHHLAFISHVA